MSNLVVEKETEWGEDNSVSEGSTLCLHIPS